jgi:hypothetical protein
MTSVIIRESDQIYRARFVILVVVPHLVLPGTFTKSESPFSGLHCSCLRESGSWYHPAALGQSVLGSISGPRLGCRPADLEQVRSMILAAGFGLSHVLVLCASSLLRLWFSSPPGIVLALGFLCVTGFARRSAFSWFSFNRSTVSVLRRACRPDFVGSAIARPRASKSQNAHLGAPLSKCAPVRTLFVGLNTLVLLVLIVFLWKFLVHPCPMKCLWDIELLCLIDFVCRSFPRDFAYID